MTTRFDRRSVLKLGGGLLAVLTAAGCTEGEIATITAA